MTWGTRILGLLAVLAVLMSGTIPQGWMPASSSGGKILLVLCTGDGTVEQWIDPSSGEPVHNDADERPACPFAGLGSDVLLAVVGHALPTTAPMRPRWSQRDFTHRSAGFHARYDARAPPFTS